MISDIATVLRLETTSRAIHEAYIDAQRRLFPKAGADRRNWPGVYAIVDAVGVESRVVVGASPEVAANPAIDAAIRWAAGRLARLGDKPFRLELGPFATAEQRQYVAELGAWFDLQTVVLGLDVGSGSWRMDPRVAQAATQRDQRMAETTIARGFMDGAEPSPAELRPAACFSAVQGFTHHVLSVLDEPAAGAALAIHDGVALLTGMSVLPAFRGQRLQSVMIRHRLALAAEARCGLALMTAAPMGRSLRNAQRVGFSILYARTNLRIDVS